MSGQFRPASDTVILLDDQDGQKGKDEEVIKVEKESTLSVLELKIPWKGLIVFVSALLLLSIVISIALPQQGRQAVREGQGSHQDLISGAYRLVSFSTNFSEYLRSIRLPEFIIPMILNSSETVTVTMPSWKNDTWEILYNNDFGENRLSFHLGKHFTIPEVSGFNWNVCWRPDTNVIKCHSVYRPKGWNFTSTMTFSNEGFVEQVVNLNSSAKVGGTKTFVRTAFGDELDNQDKSKDHIKHKHDHEKDMDFEAWP